MYKLSDQLQTQRHVHLKQTMILGAFNNDIREYCKINNSMQCVGELIRAYTRVKLNWLCKPLNATLGEIEKLAVNLILDGSVNRREDEIHSLFESNYSKKQDKLIIIVWFNRQLVLCCSSIKKFNFYQISFKVVDRDILSENLMAMLALFLHVSPLINK